MALFAFLVPRHLLFNFVTPNSPFEGVLGHSVDYEYLAILPVPPERRTLSQAEQLGLIIKWSIWQVMVLNNIK
jgi:hypothetical protein